MATGTPKKPARKAGKTGQKAASGKKAAPAKAAAGKAGARASKAKTAGKAAGGKKRAPARKSAVKAKRSWGLRLLTWALVAMIWGGLAVGLLVAYYAYDLPDVSAIAEETRRPSVRLENRQGQVIGSYGDLYGAALTLTDLPPHLPQAFVAIEDKRFYDHPGLDLIGLARAVVTNLQAGRLVQGGSTLSQQLAKNLFLGPERTLRRKVQELLLAFWLEYKLSKDQILSLYLNRVYFGAGAYGVDAAAQRFFNKSARDLGLYESATLAGLVKAPSRYNPARSPDLADKRAQLVLTAMADQGYVTAQQARTAKQQKQRGTPGTRRSGQYFADWTLTRLTGYMGQLEDDVVVDTTLDPLLQQVTEQAVAEMMAGPAKAGGASQVAVVVMDPTGAVRALVGGSSYRKSQFNRAVQALRQPGSSFKLFVYLAALEAGMKPDDRLVDEPVVVATPQGPWRPKNFAGRYYGPVTLREAFARSLNSVAVQLTEKVGPQAVADMAQRLGITSALQPLPSLALGADEVTLMDMTAAYAVMANGGRAVWPYAIDQVRSREGRVLFKAQSGLPAVIVPAAAQSGMTELLRANVDWGTGKAANPGRPAGGKTGTSQDSRDAWFIGFTSELVIGVWMGNDDGRPMKDVTGGGLPAKLFSKIARSGLEGLPSRQLAAPLAQSALEPATPASQGTGDDSEGSLLDRVLRSFSSDDENDQPGQRLPQPGASDR
ncbi:transglycosylase domain-containing protein [Rhodovibrionaceae bacterium A322]